MIQKLFSAVDFGETATKSELGVMDSIGCNDVEKDVGAVIRFGAWLASVTKVNDISTWT